MIDLKWIRENPEKLNRLLEARGAAPVAVRILDADTAHRHALNHLQDLQQQRNALAKEMGARKSKGEDTEDLTGRSNDLKRMLPEAEAAVATTETTLQDLLDRLPNCPDDAVPEGRDETGNVEVRTWGTPRSFDFTPKDHTTLGRDLGMMDFEAAAAIAGARFVVLKGPLARLERALASFMLDLHTSEFGYTEMYVPLLVRPEAMYGTGQLPKFGEDSFATTDGRWLIPTAEVSLTNLVRDQILSASALPKRFVGYTPCFRSEAGSAGRDTAGMIRQHQFTKVELVSVTTAEDSRAEHERMTQAAETVLQRLGLPYRVMFLCTGDMGSGATRTYDLEVWIPAQDKYREISSCSHCGDYQARRMGARYRPEAAGGTPAKPEFVHTLNGSGVAVGRALVAVLENYQEQDGSIRVPDVLQPYMGGMTRITADS